MTLGVLALQGDLREHAAAFADLGEEVRPVRSAGDLRGLSGVVLPGGESTTLSLLLRTTGLGPAIEEAVRGGLPAFGTCAGMILLARDVRDGRPDQNPFASIDLSVRRNAYGHQPASFEAELEVPAVGPEPLHAVFIRAPVVESVGPGVEVLGRLPARSVAEGTPVLCREGRVLVSAFHPELVADRRVHRLFLEMVKDGTVAGAGVTAGTRQGRRTAAPGAA